MTDSIRLQDFISESSSNKIINTLESILIADYEAIQKFDNVFKWRSGGGTVKQLKATKNANDPLDLTRVYQIVDKYNNREIDVLLLKEKPDMVLILGDTNSGLSAIPAAHHGIKIVHLEAGMRSYDYRMPEEKNRIMIDHLSSILFPYTQYSKENLQRENISPRKIFVIGNPIVEVLNFYSKKIDTSKILQKLNLESNDYFLITAHRSENVDNTHQLKQIFSGLEKLHKKFHKRIIFPIHPRTLNKLNFKIPKCVETFKPLGFFDFTKLEKNAFCLITDSGTVPEESFYFKKPCVSIRESTERPEYLETGSTIMSGLEPRDIVESVSLITSHTSDWEWDKFLGDGRTSSKVINIMRGKPRKILEI